mmetsp:Transcript_36808/g.80797  ORF Transcript_36808/g.80797 Transcript_36808/m.80797 type:complete len:239 (-) Transcript_36808:793-1509(-)
MHWCRFMAASRVCLSRAPTWTRRAWCSTCSPTRTPRSRPSATPSPRPTSPTRSATRSATRSSSARSKRRPMSSARRRRRRHKRRRHISRRRCRQQTRQRTRLSFRLHRSSRLPFRTRRRRCRRRRRQRCRPPREELVRASCRGWLHVPSRRPSLPCHRAPMLKPRKRLAPLRLRFRLLPCHHRVQDDHCPAPPPLLSVHSLPSFPFLNLHHFLQHHFFLRPHRSRHHSSWHSLPRHHS